MNEKANILLVDDKPQNLVVLDSILECPEYCLIHAQSANQALEVLLREDVAAIVLDIEMPEMSGLELARLIKGRRKTEHIPILFLTAHFRADEDVLSGYGAGAVDYLTKPVSPSILKSKVAVFADLFRKTRALSVALTEKENLLREVHHRVKNNLQVVTSLLDLQAQRSADSAVQAALSESQLRVRVMGLIHQILYENGNFSRVDLGQYLPRLIEVVSSAYQVIPNRITVTLDMSQVFLDLERAMPCAILVNELVTNAFKYAFPGSHRGELSLSLRATRPQHATLTVRDNGVGLPKGLDIDTTTSFGLQLVTMLARQMRARLSVLSGTGAGFALDFKTAEA